LRRPLLLALRVAGIAAVAVLLFLFLRGIDRHALAAAFRAASPPLIVLAAAVNFGTVWWKANYWQAMLSPIERIPLSRIFRYTLASVAGSVVAPGKAGEAVRIWLLKRNHGVAVSVSAGVVAMEKLGDVVALLIVVAPLAWLWMPVWLARSLLVMVAAALAGCAALWFASSHPRVQGWAIFAGLRLVRQPRVLLRGFTCILVSWLSDLAAVWLIVAALRIEAPPAAGMLILLVVNLAIAIPAMPAGAGTLELGALAAFQLLGLPRDQGLAFGLLYHAAQVLPILTAGIITGRRLMAEPAPSSEAAALPAQGAS
jgi:uncharacterized membrane protein YbhN (UPF0104 family)